MNHYTRRLCHSHQRQAWFTIHNDAALYKRGIRRAPTHCLDE
jgi:hypothetical protein